MVGAVPSDSMDLRQLRPRVGAAAYERGAEFVRRNAVSWVRWDEAAGALSGVVRGKTGTYQTVAEFVRVGDRWAFTEGDCSCPMEFDCKHVAALVLTAADRKTAADPPGQGLASWERALAPIVGGDSAAQCDTAPLALQLSLSTPSGRRGRSLTARPVRPGKSGWISGGLTWGQFAMPYYMHEFSPEQVNALSEFYAVYQARSGRTGVSGAYHAGGNQPVDLADFESPYLWTLLDDLRAAGIAIVHTRRHLGDVPAPGEAEFCLDVSQRAGGGLTVRPLVRLPADGRPVRPLVFIGTEAHGVAFAAASDHEVVAAHQRIRLARLSTTVPQQLHAMALTGGEVTVPANGAARFLDRFYYELRRRATIISSDGSFRPPEVSEPSLVLNATYRDGHELALGWQWRYDVGDAERRVPVGSGNESWRDRDAEAAAVAELGRQVAELGLDTRLPVHPGSADRSSAQLTGVDTMRFSTEMLPLLSELDGLDVEIDGMPPEYREVNDQVSIGVSTAEGDEPDWFDLDVSISVEGSEIPLAEVITALTREESHLLLDSGAYLSLDKPELQALRRLVTEARALQDTSAGLRISRYQVGLWDELASLGVVQRQAEAWREQVGGLLELDAVAADPPPATLAAELRPYQLDGYQWLGFLWRHRLGGILADDMGLGKTVQSLALICHAKAQDAAVAPFLIVAPTSVVPNWVAEARRFAPELRVAAVTETHRRRGFALADVIDGVDVVVTSYTLFRMDYDADYSAVAWSALILDEAQAVKNHQSKTYLAARKLAAPFKLAITGTPMENNLMELWSLLSITAPGLFPSPTRFEEYYAKPIEKDRDAGLLAQLRRRIRPLVKRRTKEQVAGDLPPKQEQVLEVELHPKHRRVYDRQLQRERQKVLGLVDDMDNNRFTILRSLTLLRQLSLHAGLVDDANRQVPSAKVEALIEHIADVVGSGHRALIFSQFTGFLGTIRDAVEAEGYDYCYLDGRTRDRGRVLETFKTGEVPLFLISLKAGGFGLNLTEADYCFLLDPWWNPATETQAIDRTHRIGQTKNVMVYRLIATDTIEQKVMELKERKAALFSSVMDEGNVFGSGLTADDVRSLFEE